MKILLVSFYFRPDLSAGSFRATALVGSLQKILPPGSHIDVITTLPNRYHSFSADAPQREEQPGVSIHRIALREHRSGMADQSKAFVFFARQAVRQAERGEYDIVVATSSRLMTAVLGAWIARQKRTKLFLDIRDILVDNLKHIAPKPIAWALKPALSLAERWAIGRANVVNLVSSGFAPYFVPRYPDHRFLYFTNGIDEEFLEAAQQISPRGQGSETDRPITVLYAGNLGEGQGLHAIVPRLAKQMSARVRFKIIGDGGRKQALMNELAEHGVTNVELLPPIERAQLIKTYREADVLFLHLNDYDSFKKVLPSKVFEYAAVGKPVWAGVSGYAADFVKSEITNSAVFHPCDVAGAVRAFEDLTLEDAPRTAFLTKYARENISRQMAEAIVAAASSGH